MPEFPRRYRISIAPQTPPASLGRIFRRLVQLAVIGWLLTLILPIEPAHSALDLHQIDIPPIDQHLADFTPVPFCRIPDQTVTLWTGCQTPAFSLAHQYRPVVFCVAPYRHPAPWWCRHRQHRQPDRWWFRRCPNCAALYLIPSSRAIAIPSLAVIPAMACSTWALCAACKRANVRQCIPLGLPPGRFKMPASQPSRLRILSALDVAQSSASLRWVL